MYAVCQSYQATRAKLWTREAPKAHKLKVEMQVRPWEVKLVQPNPSAQQRWKERQQCVSRVIMGRSNSAEVERCKNKRPSARVKQEQHEPVSEQHEPARERQKE